MNNFWKFAGAAAAVVMAAAQPAYADEAAEQLIQTMLDEAEPYLDSEDEAYRREGIEGLVDKYVDMRRIGYMVLGQYARKMTPEQREVYLPLFDDYASDIYQEALNRYSGEKLAIVRSLDKSDRDIVVECKVANTKPGDEYADTVIHWRIYRKTDDDGKVEMSIIDAGADGIWLAIEQSETFKSIIANNGGAPAGIDALIADLREKTSE